MGALGGWQEICVLPSAKALTWLSLLNPAVRSSSWFSGSQRDRRRQICSRKFVGGHWWGEGVGMLFPVLLSARVAPGSSDYQSCEELFWT